jgi:hypothetical protein
MTIGGSIALIALGAILRWAITWNSAYVDIKAIGVILMIAGAVCLGISIWLRSDCVSDVPAPAPGRPGRDPAALSVTAR